MKEVAANALYICGAVIIIAAVVFWTWFLARDDSHKRVLRLAVFFTLSGLALVAFSVLPTMKANDAAAGGFALLGALVGFGGSVWAAWYQDRLERNREADREDREFRRELRREEARRKQLPMLSLSFDAMRRTCIDTYAETTMEVLQGTLTPRPVVTYQTYISVIATNIGGGTAVNCIGRLAALHLMLNDQPVDQEILGSFALLWAHGKVGEQVDLAPDHDKPLNIVTAADGTLPLLPRIANGLGTRLAEALKTFGHYRFMITVNADNAPAVSIYLHIVWDKTFAGRWDEPGRIWSEPVPQTIQRATGDE